MVHADIIESVGSNDDSDSGDGGPDANDLLMPDYTYVPDPYDIWDSFRI